jgi:hypothetical protein
MNDASGTFPVWHPRLRERFGERLLFLTLGTGAYGVYWREEIAHWEAYIGRYITFGKTDVVLKIYENEKRREAIIQCVRQMRGLKGNWAQFEADEIHCLHGISVPVADAADFADVSANEVLEIQHEWDRLSENDKARLQNRGILICEARLPQGGVKGFISVGLASGSVGRVQTVVEVIESSQELRPRTIGLYVGHGAAFSGQILLETQVSRYEDMREIMKALYEDLKLAEIETDTYLVWDAHENYTQRPFEESGETLIRRYAATHEILKEISARTRLLLTYYLDMWAPWVKDPCLDRCIREFVYSVATFDEARFRALVLDLAVRLENCLRERLVEAAKKRWAEAWVKESASLGISKPIHKAGLGEFVTVLENAEQLFGKPVLSSKAVLALHEFVPIRNACSHGRAAIPTQEFQHQLASILNELLDVISGCSVADAEAKGATDTSGEGGSHEEQ